MTKRKAVQTPKFIQVWKLTGHWSLVTVNVVCEDEGSCWEELSEIWQKERVL